MFAVKTKLDMVSYDLLYISVDTIFLQKLDKVIFTATFIVRIQTQHRKDIMNGFARIFARFASTEINARFVANFKFIG